MPTQSGTEASPLIDAAMAVIFALLGLNLLFGARRARDDALSSVKGDGFFARMNRYFLTRPGLVLFHRIFGLFALAISVFMATLLLGWIH